MSQLLLLTGSTTTVIAIYLAWLMLKTSLMLGFVNGSPVQPFNGCDG
jgi:hypothetical protein